LVVNVIYTGIAYLLYKYRKAEDVSKPYVYKAYFYAIMTMAVFCILSLFITYNGFVIAGIVICAVGWFIMEVITRRGFKKFWTAPIGFAIAVISVFAICQVCKVTDGFGASKYVPSVISVENVKITNYNIGYNNISYKDKDVIKAAVELNKEIVDRHFNPDDYTYEPISDDTVYLDYYDDSDITIEYSTITGTTVKRRYTVNTGMLDNLTKAILLSDEYAEYSANQIGTNNIYGNGNTLKYTIEISDKLNSNSGNRTLTNKQMKEIRQAYTKDMKAMTEEDLTNSDIYCFIDNYWVLESFENTIAVLDTDIEPISKNTIRSAVIPMVIDPVFRTYVKGYMESNENSNYSHYYGTHEYQITKSETITNVYPQSIYNDLTGNKVSLVTNNDDVIELLDRFTPIIIGEMPLAVIKIDNSVFYLPDRNENAELLEKVIEKSSKTRTAPVNKTTQTDVNDWDL
ncbi:MAG: hypothetical protein K2H19_09095, partial [Ruminococcus sp.]|nr:hypothetical protein [Ruminococcus sp.]